MKNLVKFCVLVLMFAALTISCGKKKSSEKITVGFSQCILDSPFYVALMDAASAEASKNGIEFVYLDAQNNIQKQNNDILDLVNRGVDVLLINPVDPDGVKPALDRARKANIPIVTVDRPVNGKVNAFVGRDNKKMGKIAGKLAVKLLGGPEKAKGKILELQGDAGGSVMMARRDGFHSEVDKESGIKVIQSPYCGYVRANAVKAAQDLIQAHPDIVLIYAHNDDMALGGLQVFEQSKKKVMVVGVDGLMEAVLAITKGRYHGTAMNDPAKLGILAIETAIKLAKGQSVKSYIDGGTLLIDKSNAKKYYSTSDIFATSK